MTEIIHLQATIPNEMADQRLDRVLVALFPNYSRARLQNWLKEKQITVDGQYWRGKDKVRGGETVCVQASLEPQTHWEGQKLPLTILYEDDDLIVVDKPAGLVVHPATGNPDNTLVNALLHHHPNLSALPRAGIVHRLDKDTSGLLVIAKTLTAHAHLVDALQKRDITREYEAIVSGLLTAGDTINAPMGRHPRNRLKMAVVAHGKPAITHFRILQRFKAHTHVRVTLETGRTHQIRVHMAHIHHALVGDPLYNGRLHIPKGTSEALRDALRQFKRQALHARRLSLDHPQTGERLSWESPLADDMQTLLHILQDDMTC